MANNGNSPGKKAKQMWENDPMMKNLWEAKMSWANVMEKYDPNAFKPKGVAIPNNANKVRVPSWVPKDEYFQKRVAELLEWEDHDSFVAEWSVPNLKLRKDIWENFPVVLTPIDDGDRTARYAITWHIKHIDEWSDNPRYAVTFAEHMDYTSFSEYKLLYSLSKHSKQYVIEPPRSEDQIAVIAMVHGAPRNGNVTRNRRNNRANARGNTRNNKSKRNRNHSVPVLKSLKDIKELFPVVWHDVPGKAGTKTYALEFHKKNLQQMAQSSGKSVAEITKALMAALEASTFWHVLKADDGSSICRLEMITKK